MVQRCTAAAVAPEADARPALDVVSQLISGQSVRDLITAYGELSEDAARAIARQILHNLAVLHRAGRAHGGTTTFIGDSEGGVPVLTRATPLGRRAPGSAALSATNVLVEPSGQAWLTDYDLAPFRFGTLAG